ncbi:MAG: sugar ABC transporter permease [Solobacterium sp.]|nr:sugar ABC transporter permease [Solobacterium sp.]
METMENRRKRQRTMRILRENLTWYSFIIVTLLAIILLVYLPTVTTVLFSLSDVSLKGLETTFIGFHNYKVIFAMSSFWKSILNTLGLAALGLLTIPLGFLLANAINSLGKGPTQSFFRVAFYLPNIITGVSVILIFQIVLKGNNGILNSFLSLLVGQNVSIGWLSSSQYSWFGATILYIWSNLGYSMLMNLSSMQAIPSELYEAASIDGASRFQQMIHITVPNMRACYVFLFVTGMISGLARFTDLYIIGGNSASGKPGGTLQTILMFIFQYSFDSPQYGMSSAGAVVLFFLTLMFTLLNVKMTGMLKEDK